MAMTRGGGDHRCHRTPGGGRASQPVAAVRSRPINRPGWRDQASIPAAGVGQARGHGEAIEIEKLDVEQHQARASSKPGMVIDDHDRDSHARIVAQPGVVAYPFNREGATSGNRRRSGAATSLRSSPRIWRSKGTAGR